MGSNLWLHVANTRWACGNAHSHSSETVDCSVKWHQSTSNLTTLFQLVLMKSPLLGFQRNSLIFLLLATTVVRQAVATPVVSFTEPPTAHQSVTFSGRLEQRRPLREQFGKSPFRSTTSPPANGGMAQIIKEHRFLWRPASPGRTGFQPLALRCQILAAASPINSPPRPRTRKTIPARPTSSSRRIRSRPSSYSLR